MVGLFAGIVGQAVKGLFGVIDQVVEDKDQAARLKAKLQEQALAGQLKELEAAASVIVAEAKGDSWLQRNWWPMLMCLFGLIVANNYIIAPYAALFFRVNLELSIPPDMWDLLKIGVGGYVVGRSAEKGIKAWQER